MPIPEPQLGYFFPVGGGLPELPWKPGGEKPKPPITLPPFPGFFPKPGEPAHPIEIPEPGPGDGGEIQPPIFIPEEPGHPFPIPPGVIWPPLPPDLGLSGKTAILIWVSGVGARWLVIDTPTLPTPPPGGWPPLPEFPGRPQPK